MEDEKFYIDGGASGLNKSMMGLQDDEDWGDDLRKSRESMYDEGFIKANALLRHMEKADREEKKGKKKVLGMGIR